MVAQDSLLCIDRIASHRGDSNQHRDERRAEILQSITRLEDEAVFLRHYTVLDSLIRLKRRVQLRP